MVDITGTPDIRLELKSEPNLLSAIRALVVQVSQRIGFPEKECGQIALALDEAICNVINHGYSRRPDGRIWVSIWQVRSDPPSIQIVLEDLGRQVDPATIRSRDLDDIRPGGLGVHIIHQTMDHVKYEKREAGGMRLTMVKRMSAASARPARDRQPASAASQPQPPSGTLPGGASGGPTGRAGTTA